MVMTVEKVLHVSISHDMMEEVLDQWPDGFDNGFWLDADWIDLTSTPILASYLESIDNPEHLDIFLDWSWCNDR